MGFLHESPLLWFHPEPLSHVINDFEKHEINLLPLWFTNCTNQKSLGLFSNPIPRDANRAFGRLMAEDGWVFSRQSVKWLVWEFLRFPAPSFVFPKSVSRFSSTSQFVLCALPFQSGNLCPNASWSRLLRISPGDKPLLFGTAFLGRMGQREFQDFVGAGSLIRWSNWVFRFLPLPLKKKKNKNRRRKNVDKVACHAGDFRTNLYCFLFFFPLPSGCLPISVLFPELFPVAQGGLHRVALLGNHVKSLLMIRDL